MNRLGRERWLRHLVVQDPRLAGVSLPELVEPIPPRTNLLEAAPAALLAVDGDARVLVTFPPERKADNREQWDVTTPINEVLANKRGQR